MTSRPVGKASLWALSSVSNGNSSEVFLLWTNWVRAEGGLTLLSTQESSKGHRKGATPIYYEKWKARFKGIFQGSGWPAPKASDLDHRG